MKKAVVLWVATFVAGWIIRRVVERMRWAK